MNSKNGLFAFLVHGISSTIDVVFSDISSDIPYEKSAAYAKIGLLEPMTECNGGIMVKLSETELKMLVKGERQIQLS